MDASLIRRLQARARKCLEDPEQYIGPTELVFERIWVLKEERIVLDTVEWSQGLFRIVDDLFCFMTSLPSVSSLSFKFTDKGISVSSDAPCNSLATALNTYLFLCAVFSKTMVIENNGKEWVFMDHMLNICESVCKVTGCSITISIDYDMFEEGDTRLLLRRRVYDIAVMNRKLAIDLDGEEIGVKRWYQYTKLLLHKGEKLHRYKIDNEYSLYVLPADQGVAGDLTFVNGMWVPRGPHVDVIRKQLIGFLSDCYCFSDSKSSSLLFFILECTVKDPQFENPAKLHLTSGAEQVAGWVLPKQFLRKIARSQIHIGTALSPHRMSLSREVRARCRSVCINLDRFAFASNEDFRNDNEFLRNVPDMAYYALVTDVPLDFDPNEALKVTPNEFLANILRDIDDRDKLDTHLVSLYQTEIEPEMLPVYHLIGWILSTRMRFPKSDRLKSTEELHAKAFEHIMWLKSMTKITDHLGDMARNPLELPMVTQKLIESRQALRNDLMKIAQSGDTKCIVYANSLMSVYDRLILIGSKFPEIRFSPEDLRVALIIANRSIAAMKGFKRYHEVLFFVDGHTNDIEEYLDDLVQLVSKVHLKLHARKALKAETRVRSSVMACKWISMHLTDEPVPVYVPMYSIEYTLAVPRIEADAIDWNAYMLDVRNTNEDFDDSELESCMEGLHKLLSEPLQCVLFFKKWLPILNEQKTYGRRYHTIETMWNMKIRDIQNRYVVYKSPPVLVKLVKHYSLSICEYLITKVDASAHAEFVETWSTYFENVHAQFQEYESGYSSQTLWANINYLMEIKDSFKAFKEQCCEIEENSETELVFLATSMVLCMSKILDFLDSVEKSMDKSLADLLTQVFDSCYAFKSSLEARLFDSRMFQFFVTFSTHEAFLLKLATICTYSRSSIDANTVEMVKELFLQFSSVAHLGRLNDAKMLVETLTVLFHKVQTIQNPLTAFVNATIMLSNMIVRLIDRLNVNMDSGVVPESEITETRKWVTFLHERQEYFAELAQNYRLKTYEQQKQLSYDLWMFTQFLIRFEELFKNRASLAIEIEAEQMRNSLKNVIAMMESFKSFSGGGILGVPTRPQGITQSGSITSSFSRGTLNLLYSGLRVHPAESKEKHAYSVDDSSLCETPVLQTPTKPRKTSQNGGSTGDSDASSSCLSSSSMVVTPIPDRFLHTHCSLRSLRKPEFLAWNVRCLQQRIFCPQELSLSVASCPHYRERCSFLLPPFDELKQMDILDLLRFTESDLQETDSHEYSVSWRSQSMRSITQPRQVRRASVSTGNRVHQTNTDNGRPTLAATARVGSVSPRERAGIMTYDLKRAARTLVEILKKLQLYELESSMLNKLQAMSQAMPEILSCLPKIVKASRQFGQEQMVINCIRNYEMIRERFRVMIEDIDMPFDEVDVVHCVEMCGRQLSVLVGCLKDYASQVTDCGKDVLQSIPRVSSYLAKMMDSLSIIIDCSDIVAVVVNADFFGALARSICAMSTLIDNLEDMIRKDILAYCRDLLLANLTRINGFCQNFVRKQSTKPGDVQKMMLRVKEHAEELVRQQLEEDPESDMSICADIVLDCLKTMSIDSPGTLLDLKRIGTLVENLHIHTRDKDVYQLLQSIVELRILMSKRLWTGMKRQSEDPLTKMVRRDQTEIKNLITMIQTQSLSSETGGLKRCHAEWIHYLSSLSEDLTTIVDIFPVFPALPLGYIEAERYFGEIETLIRFFEDPDIASSGMSLISFRLRKQLRETSDFAFRSARFTKTDNLSLVYSHDNVFTQALPDKLFTESDGQFWNVLITVLGKPFDLERSGNLCHRLLTFIHWAHVHYSDPYDIELLKERARECVQTNEDHSAHSRTDRQHLNISLAIVDFVTRIIEVEGIFLSSAKVDDVWAPAKDAYSILRAKLIASDIQCPEWEPKETKFADVCASLPSLLGSLCGITEGFLSERQSVPEFHITETQLARLWTLKRGENAKGVCLSDFYNVTSLFEQHRTDEMLDAFAEFYSNIQDELLFSWTELFRNKVAWFLTCQHDSGKEESLIREVIAAAASIRHRLCVIQSSDVNVLRAALSHHLTEWTGSGANQTIEFVAQCVIELALVTLANRNASVSQLSGVLHAVEKLRFESLSGTLPVASDTAGVISDVLRATEDSISGALAARMNLSLVRCHIK